nr:50S ribosomal protein L6 [Desulfobulbaceae bacterium]
MSRIGKKPITLPKGVNVTIAGDLVTVKGPRGTLQRETRPEIDVVLDGEILTFIGKDDTKQTNALKGMTRSLVNNMVVGTNTGFQKKLLVEGVGYRVNVAGSKITLSVGYSNPVDFQLPDSVSATNVNNEITLESINKEELGLVAAKIRDIRKPEPYKGKGIRYQNEHIVRKVGKSAGKK